MSCNTCQAPETAEERICRREKNEQGCTCTEFGCKQHGYCCECIAKHRGRGQYTRLPVFRREKSFTTEAWKHF